jgi:hypothetical protein
MYAGSSEATLPYGGQQAGGMAGGVGWPRGTDRRQGSVDISLAMPRRCVSAGPVGDSMQAAQRCGDAMSSRRIVQCIRNESG